MKYNSRPTWRYQWLAILALCALSLVFIFVAIWGLVITSAIDKRVALGVIAALMLFFCLLTIYRRYAWRFNLDEKNIESRRGIIARNLQSIRIQDLRNVNVRQSIMQRLLGIGDVEFSTAAGGGIEVNFFGVDDPVGVKDLAQKLQGAHKSTRTSGSV